MHRRTCSLHSTEPLPDLSSLFKQLPPLDHPGPSARIPDGSLPERKRTSGLSRYSTRCFRFFEQMPLRKIRDTDYPVLSREIRWSMARKAALARDLYRCQRCQSDDQSQLTVHHIFPRGLGGGNEPGNLVTLCETCHQGLCRQCARPVSHRVVPGETSNLLQEQQGPSIIPAAPAGIQGNAPAVHGEEPASI